MPLVDVRAGSFWTLPRRVATGSHHGVSSRLPDVLCSSGEDLQVEDERGARLLASASVR